MESRGYDTILVSIYNGKQNTSIYGIGFWEYWYENGNKRLETFYDREGEHYINFWLPNGKQILFNGVGLYYEIESLGGGKLQGKDSSVYEIENGIKNGHYNDYRSYKHGAYFWVGSGFYLNDKKTGLHIFKDSIYNYFEKSNYIDDKKNGEYQEFYPNGKPKEIGQKIDDLDEGTWKFYNDSGIPIKEVNYKNGYKIGDYKEFHSNGKIVVLGRYIQVSGTLDMVTVDVNGDEVKTKEHYDNVPKKDGIWEYYDENGKLIETKTYKEDVLIKK